MIKNDLRRRARKALKDRGLLAPAQKVRKGVEFAIQRLTASELRLEKSNKKQFRQFSLQYGDVLRERYTVAPRCETVLVVGRTNPNPGKDPLAKIPGQLLLVKAAQMAGYKPAVLLTGDPNMSRYFELAGVEHIEFWEPTAGAAGFLEQAKRMLVSCESLRDLLELEHDGVRVGRSAVSTMLRHSQSGTLMVGPKSSDKQLANYLSQALAAQNEAGRIVSNLKPAITISSEMEYTPKREMFDATMARGGQAIVICRGHRNNMMMLRRYSVDGRRQHPCSMSDSSWELMKRMTWSEEKSRKLFSEYQSCYENDDWWGIPSKQLNHQALTKREISTRLDLDVDKKSAIIFAHVPWDASSCWGDDLFQNYEEWLVETVRVACTNHHINWIVKIHPANIVKSRRVSDGQEPLEVSVLRQHIGPLPSHVSLVPADVDLSTLTLLSIADYCLTVRGTVGIEAASMGIPVVTGGTGRYDRRGFTIDSSSTAEYLEHLRHIQTIAGLTPLQQELAQRFAFGILLVRPLPLEPRWVEMSRRVERDRWYSAKTLSTLAQWLRESDAEDFLQPFDVS